MSHKIIGLFAILLLFSVETFATQPKQKSEIDKFRNLELQVHRLQRDFDSYLKKLDRDPGLESKSKLLKSRLLSQLRQIENKTKGDLSLRALKLMKDVHDVRAKLRTMDREVKNIHARNEAISFAKNKSLHRQAKRQPKKIQKGAATALVSGTVTDETGTVPVPYTEVDIYDSTGNWISYGYSDEAGAYSAEVEQGTYFARTNTYSNYLNELYSEIECVPSCDVKTGTPIVVTGNVGGINFTMDTPGQIAGTVTDAATNAPLIDISIDIYDTDGNWRANGHTDSTGNYITFGQLNSGSYFAVASDYNQGYLSELYQELPCSTGCDIQNGTPISVVQGQITSGINFTLDKGGIISGKVLSSGNSSPVSGSVSIYDSNGNYVTDTYTDSKGNYEAKGLPTGNYFAVTSNYEGFIDELYDNIVCYQQYCEPTTGSVIAVTLGQTTSDINFLLDRGGIIRGHVKDKSTSKPIEYVGVSIYDSGGNYVGYGYTDDDGGYAVKGLIHGTYYALTCTYGEYIDELYDDIECPGGSCDPLTGTPIEVKNGDASQANFNLMRGGSIAGKVVDSSNGKPIEYKGIAIYDSSGNAAGYGYTDESGKYVTTGLATGNYFALSYSYNDNYIDELYDNHPCPFQSCDVTTGEKISVTAAKITSGINFALDVGGSISGTVTTSDSNPIGYIYTYVFDSQGNYVRAGYSTDENGHYSALGLPTGNYYETTRNWNEYVDELYNNIPCTAGICNPLIGAPIAVTKGSDTPGIDFVLDPGGSISGKIYDAQTAAPIEYVYVNVFDSAGNTVSYGYADENGNYRAEDVGLSTGTYFTTSYSYYGDYLNELYDNMPCNNSCDVLTGTPIQVTTGADTGNIDFALDHGGSISGTIIDEVTSTPISYSYLNVYDSSGHRVSYAYTDNIGNYTINNLEGGSYYVVTQIYDHINEVYDNIVCPGGVCDPLSGSAVSVTQGADTPGIDFALQACNKLTFTPNVLPPGIVDASYQQTISVSGGAPPYTLEIEGGYLPNGITLDEATGIISGSPTAAGFFGFVIEATDSNGCSSGWKYSITIDSGSSQYSDDFEDGILAADWTYKGQWMETGGSLTSTANRKSSATSGNHFTGCVNCALNTTIRTNTTDGHVSLLAWYQDQHNYVELIMKAGRDRWILKQHSGGKIVAKEKAAIVVQPDVTYDVSIWFNGTKFVVSVNNQAIITMPSGALPNAGKVGYEVRSTAGFFDFIQIQ